MCGTLPIVTLRCRCPDPRTVRCVVALDSPRQGPQPRGGLGNKVPSPVPEIPRAPLEGTTAPPDKTLLFRG